MQPTRYEHCQLRAKDVFHHQQIYDSPNVKIWVRESQKHMPSDIDQYVLFVRGESSSSSGTRFERIFETILGRGKRQGEIGEIAR